MLNREQEEAGIVKPLTKKRTVAGSRDSRHWQLLVTVLSKERRGKVSMFNSTAQASRKKD